VTAAVPFRCAAVVTDIEGTTGSIAFVHDVLFPYAQAHLAAFVAERGAQPEVAAVLRDAAVAAGEPDAGPGRVVEVLRAWIEADRKITPLKTLQGLIWADGYARGELRGHVYPDAAAGLRRWHAAGFPLYVYSSGSIAAQQLLFGHSEAGDLRPLFSGYFDTTIGAKSDATAYAAIARTIATSPEHILFLSDREAELDAAHAAGWQSGCLARPADAPAGAMSAHPTFTSFDEIEVQAVAR
jgi:enolase-phosphatase E1